MVIKVSVKYNGGLLIDVILLTLCDYIGETFQTIKSVCQDSQF